MEILSKVGGFVSRHHIKFTVATAMVVGPLCLAYYGKQKLMNWQNNYISKFIEKTQTEMYFEHIQSTLNNLIVNLVPLINKALDEAMNTENMLDEIQKQLKDNEKLWDETVTKKSTLLLAFTKIVCVVYVCNLLVMVTRIQMNLLGGLLNIDTNAFSFEEQNCYLMLSENVLDTGLSSVKKLVLEKISEVLSLKQELTISEIKNLFWTIQATMQESSKDPIKNLNQIVLGNIHQILGSRTAYDAMILDTCDLLRSEEVRNLTSESIICSLALVSDKLLEFYLASSSSSDVPICPSSVKIPATALVSIIYNLLSENDLSLLIVQFLIKDYKLKTFDANIFEAFGFDYNNI